MFKIQDAKLTPENLESFLLSWKCKKPLSLTIFDKHLRLKIRNDHVEIIKKYKNLGIVKEFNNLFLE